MQEKMALIVTNGSTNNKIPHVLTMAGSDSGELVQEYKPILKTCATRGAFCSTVFTVVSSQYTFGDISILPEGKGICCNTVEICIVRYAC
ncbi:putative transferase [Helianthus annuus]|nr:putative transferase [Helianthus annuus]KAJ0552679.1 putative transferase [Helianthus annuus]